MNWMRDAVWQQGIAIVLVISGAAWIHRAAQDSDAALLPAFLLLAAGIALPLVSSLWRARGGTQDQGGEAP